MNAVVSISPRKGDVVLAQGPARWRRESLSDALAELIANREEPIRSFTRADDGSTEEEPTLLELEVDELVESEWRVGRAVVVRIYPGAATAYPARIVGAQQMLFGAGWSLVVRVKR